MYQVKDWNEQYENAQSRKLKHLNWFPVPNNTDGMKYCRLMSNKKNGLEIYGVWVLILSIASRCPVRGNLAHSDGTSFSIEDISLLTRVPEQKLKTSIEVLLEMGWLIEGNQQENGINGEPATDLPLEYQCNGSGPPESQVQSPTEQNRREQKEQKEQNRNIYVGRAARTLAIKMIELINELKGSRFENVDSSIKPIKCRIREVWDKGLDPKEVEKMVRRQWKKWGSDDHMHQYFTPGTLFRASNFWNYMGDRDSKVTKRMSSMDLRTSEGSCRKRIGQLRQKEKRMVNGTVDWGPHRDEDGKLKPEFAAELSELEKKLNAIERDKRELT